jgi:hypothetical protein
MPAKFIRLVAAVFIAANALGSQTASLARETEFLEAEITLARKQQIYFVFQLKDKKIQLKARGIALREWDIEKMRFFGDGVRLKPVALNKKITLFPPKRESIKPGNKDEKDEFKIESLELKDMPSRYTLFLDAGISIYVRPKPGSIFSKLGSAWRSLKWHTIPPLKMVLLSARNRPFTAVDVVLKSRQETQALFWAFSEGFECIVY